MALLTSYDFEADNLDEFYSTYASFGNADIEVFPPGRTSSYRVQARTNDLGGQAYGVIRRDNDAYFNSPDVFHSFWIRTSSLSVGATVGFFKVHTASGAKVCELKLNVYNRIELYNYGGALVGTSVDSITAGSTWYLIELRSGVSHLELYFNGTLVVSTAQSSGLSTVDYAIFGNNTIGVAAMTMSLDDYKADGETYPENGGSTYRPAGGVVVGGSATVTSTSVVVPSGGVVVGGSAALQRAMIYNTTPSGGVVIGGSAVFDFGATPEIAGGVVVGGSASISSVVTHAVSGGVVCGGSAIITAEYTVVPSGGVVIGTPPYDNGYFHRVKITVPAGRVASDLERFLLPVRVTLDPTEATDDVLFTDAGGNRLPHDLVGFNSLSGKLWAYVRTNLVAEADNVLYLYY